MKNIKWLEANAEVEEFKAQKKEIEEIVKPIISKFYQQSGGSQGGEQSSDEKDEL